MKKIIVLTGDLACGKTTFANIISKKYNIDLFVKDYIKEHLADTIGFKNREENRRLSIMAVNQQIEAINKNISENKDIVVEANFRDYEIDKINELAKKNNAKVLIIEFQGDPNIIFNRYNHRIKFENRHPAHLSQDFSNFEEFKSYIFSNRIDSNKYDFIKINANNFSYQTDEKLFKTIETFLFKEI